MPVMASQFSRLRLTAVPLAGLAGTLFLTSTTVHADEPPSKKSIYDAPPPLLAPPSTPPTRPTRPTPTDRLAQEIGSARRFINAHYRLACSELDTYFTTYLSYEHSITRTLAELAPSSDSPERILPGSIYVAVATMAGGILTRRKIWPVRAVTPVLVGVAAAWCFIPETARNVGDLLWEWERKAPRVAETHLAVRESVEAGLRRTVETVEGGRRKVDEAAKGVRKAVEELVKKG